MPEELRTPEETFERLKRLAMTTRSRFTSDEMLAACHAAEIMMERRAAALEAARKALRQVSSACVFTDVRRCSQRFVHQYDWCSGCISSAALAALDAATTVPTSPAGGHN